MSVRVRGWSKCAVIPDPCMLCFGLLRVTESRHTVYSTGTSSALSPMPVATPFQFLHRMLPIAARLLTYLQVCDKVRERGSTYLGILRGEQLATRGSGGGSGSSSRSVGSGNGSSSVGGTAQAGSRREGVGAEQRRLSLGLPHEGPGAVVTLQPGDRLVVLAVR